ncbi:MAG: 3'-5' exonuclease, partial [Dehalococcoidales bacterium]|nr:3'-5' exonuclease [Dehalococcoidales bacterium]
MTNEKLAKVFYNDDISLNRSDYKLRELGFRTWENKISAEVRFRTIAEIKSGILNNKRIQPVDEYEIRQYHHVIDIEVSAGLKVPNPSSAPVKITCMTVLDKRTGIMHVMHTAKVELGNIKERIVLFIKEELAKSKMRHEEGKIYTEAEDFKFEYEIVEHRFENESDMLWFYVTFVVESDPDNIGGYNPLWDMRYIASRLKQNHLDHNLLSPVKEVETYSQRFEILGREIFDVRKFYLNMRAKSDTDLEESTLDFIARYELGCGQKKFRGSFKEKWNEDPLAVIERNIIDVYLTDWLDKHFKLMEQ